MLSSGMLRSVGWFGTDVSELRISPIFKGQAIFLGMLHSVGWFGTDVSELQICSIFKEQAVL
jgi:hypothetical protein